MKPFRRVVFWCHLLAGVFAGTVVLIMSVTGVLLTFERQIVRWADARAYRVAPPSPGAARLPVDSLVAAARGARAATPSSVTVRPGPAAPVEVGFGREGALFVNPYTGDVLGAGSRRVRGFFRAVTDWHRWLGASDERRTLGRAITGACNLAFLFLVVSGAYLWIPRPWTRSRVRNAAWFRRRLSGKARDFNWHNAIGVWSAVPLFVVVLSATVISYPWATGLVYRAVGEAPPPPRAAPGQPPRGENGPERRGVGGATAGLERLLARAERQTPGWRSIQMQLPAPAAASVTFTIDEGSGGQPQKRAQLTLDRASGGVVRFEPFSSYTRGRRLRSLLRFAHTGEVAGIVGQTVAGIASLGGVVLVWTGLALAWRRLRAWRARRDRPATEAGETAEAA